RIPAGARESSSARGGARAREQEQRGRRLGGLRSKLRDGSPSGAHRGGPDQLAGQSREPEGARGRAQSRARQLRVHGRQPVRDRPSASRAARGRSGSLAGGPAGGVPRSPARGWLVRHPDHPRGGSGAERDVSGGGGSARAQGGG